MQSFAEFSILCFGRKRLTRVVCRKIVPKGEKIKINKNTIEYLTLSQEDLIKAGVFDIPMAIKALKQGLLRYKEGRILFPDKIVQIFNDETQERMQCISVHYKQVWEQNHSCKNR